MHFVACKTVREYNRNQEEIKAFLLTEKKNAQKNQNRQNAIDNSTGPQIPNDQAGPSKPQRSNIQMDQPGPSNAQRTQQPKAPRRPKRKGTAPMKRTNKPTKDFDTRSKEAALAQKKLEKAKQRQKDKARSPRIQLDMSRLQQNKSIEVINLTSDSSQESPFQIITSNSPKAFMYAQPEERDNSTSKREGKIDKIIKKITNSPKKLTTEPEVEQLITIIPASTSTPIGNNTKARPTTDNIHQLQPTGNNTTTQQQTKEDHLTEPTGPTTSTQQDNYTENTPDSNNDIIADPQTKNNDNTDIPEERQDPSNENDNIHMEEKEDDHIEEKEDDGSGTSSISSLNTADIEALDKIFD